MNANINVFKNKNYSLLFYGVLVSNVAHILFNFVMSLYVLRISEEVFGKDNAPLVQGIYLGLAGLVLVIFMPFGGVLADRVNKVRVMYITDYIRGAFILIVGLIIYLDPSASVKLIFLFVMNIVLGLNSAFFNPASGSLLKFIVTEEELPQASSYLHGSMNLQNIAGLILGGIMFSTFSIYVIFFINGLAYVISALTEMFIKYDYKKKNNLEKTKVFVEMKSGIKYLYNYKPMFSLILMALSLNFFIVPILNNGFPYFIEYGLAEEMNYLFMGFLTVENWYSIILICFSLSGIMMALVLSKQKKRNSYGTALMKSIVGFGVAITVLAIIMVLYFTRVLPINITLILILVACLLLGLASTAFNVPVQIIMQNNINPDQLGKVVSVSSVLSQALIPFASLLAGIIISKLSIVLLYVVCTLGIITVVVTYYYKRSYIKL